MKSEAPQNLTRGETALLDYLHCAGREGGVDLKTYCQGRPGARGELLGVVSLYETWLRGRETGAAGSETKETPAPAKARQEVTENSCQPSSEFRVIREIGRGGMGVVYEAEQLSLGRRVALKVLPDTFAMDATRRTLFEREATALARVRHPRVVEIHDIIMDGERPQLVMEYIEGVSLGEQLRESRTSPSDVRPAALAAKLSAGTYESGVIQLVIQILEGVSAIHDAGIVHRDLKPDNIMLLADGSVKITDFGLAKDLMAASGMSSLGAPRGTPAYMSPEQAVGNLMGIDERSDLFSVGILLFELLGGRLPFEGESWQSVARAIVTSPPPPLRKLNPTVSKDLALVVEKALEKSPEARYRSAAEFAGDLRRCLDRKPIVHGRPSLADRWRKFWRAQSPLARAGALLFVVSFPLYVLAMANIDPFSNRNSAWDLLMAVAGIPLVGGVGTLLVSLFHRKTSRALPAGFVALCVLAVATMLCISYFRSPNQLEEEVRQTIRLRDFAKAAARITGVPPNERSLTVQLELVKTLWYRQRWEEALTELEESIDRIPAGESASAVPWESYVRYVAAWNGWPRFFSKLERRFGDELFEAPALFLGRASRLLFLAEDRAMARRYAEAALASSGSLSGDLVEAYETLARVAMESGSLRVALDRAIAASREIASVGRENFRLIAIRFWDPIAIEPPGLDATVRIEALLHALYRLNGHQSSAGRLAKELAPVASVVLAWSDQLEALAAASK